MNNSKNAQKRIRQKALNTARKNSGNENQAFNNRERIRKDPRLKALNLINPVEGTPRVPTLNDIKQCTVRQLRYQMQTQIRKSK